MYRRSKFVEILHEIRREMSAEADFDVDIFAEAARSANTTITAQDRKSLAADSADAAGKIEPLVGHADA